MDDLINDDHKPVGARSDSPSATGINGEDTPPAEKEVEALGDSAAAELVLTPERTGVIPEPASVRALPSDTEQEEHYTKAQLIEFGRRFAKKQKENRRRARARAAEEKAKGILTITFKCHEKDRRLMMGAMKNLNLTIRDMHKANLSTEPLDAALTKFLRDFYKNHVKS